MLHHHSPSVAKECCLARLVKIQSCLTFTYEIAGHTYAQPMWEQLRGFGLMSSASDGSKLKLHHIKYSPFFATACKETTISWLIVGLVLAKILLVNYYTFFHTKWVNSWKNNKHISINTRFKFCMMACGNTVLRICQCWWMLCIWLFVSLFSLARSVQLPKLNSNCLELSFCFECIYIHKIN